MSSYAKDLGDSAHDFTYIVWPKLKALGWLTGIMLPVEAVTDDTMKEYLDRLAGIDLWVINDDKGITGLASRIQWGARAWNSFTVRRTRATGTATEWEKRRTAMASQGQYIYPYWSCQAYVTVRPSRVNGRLMSCGQLLSVGLARTEDIFDHLERTPVTHRETHSDGNTFFVAWWGQMQGAGYPVSAWAPTNNSPKTDPKTTSPVTDRKKTPKNFVENPRGIHNGMPDPEQRPSAASKGPAR